MQNTRLCLSCGDEISGRIDKRFCCDQCRNTYNNQLKKNTNNYMRKVDNSLKKNRRILEELNPNSKTKVFKTILLNRGFNFEYHTNTYTTKKGQTYYFCYEHGYLPLDDGYYALVKREDSR